jgi:hypothetical protein
MLQIEYRYIFGIPFISTQYFDFWDGWFTNKQYWKRFNGGNFQTTGSSSSHLMHEIIHILNNSTIGRFRGRHKSTR